jgi:hypothetical protein
MSRTVHIGGLRIHHGIVGVAFVTIGTALIAHDWRDFPWRLHDM